MHNQYGNSEELKYIPSYHQRSPRMWHRFYASVFGSEILVLVETHILPSYATSLPHSVCVKSMTLRFHMEHVAPPTLPFCMRKPKARCIWLDEQKLTSLYIYCIFFYVQRKLVADKIRNVMKNTALFRVSDYKCLLLIDKLMTMSEWRWRGFLHFIDSYIYLYDADVSMRDIAWMIAFIRVWPGAKKLTLQIWI